MALSVMAVSSTVSPLDDGRGRDRHVHDIRAEPLAGDLEGTLRAGRGLEEEIDLGAPLQHGMALVDLPADLDIASRRDRAA